MATKTVILSDLSGDELADDQHTRVQVRHPDMSFAVELDVSTDEADKLVNTTLRLVEFQIWAPNKPPRTALVETKTLDTVFKDVDFDKVLEGARKVEQSRQTPAKRAAKAAAPAAAGGEKLDYTAPENAGKLHRGRITDAEAQWVRENQDKASYNREQQTGKPIDWNDAAEKKRYSLS